DEHVPAVLQSDGFISPARFNSVARIWVTKGSLHLVLLIHIQHMFLLLRARLIAGAHQTFAPDGARPEDRNVCQVLAPNKTVMPMTVTEVLISIPLIWFGRIVLHIA